MKKEQLKADNYKLCNIDQVKVDEILDKYPSNRKASAVIPLLHYVQKKSNGWLPVPEIERVAEILDMPYMKVYDCLLYTSPSPRDATLSRMPSSA